MENIRILRIVIWLTAAVGAGGMLLVLVAIPILTWRLIAALIIVALALAYALRTALALAAELDKRSQHNDKP